MKRKVMIILIICVILVLPSCTLWNIIMGTHISAASMGTLLTVDSNGHFTENIVYDMGDTTTTFSSNGQYESLTYSYSSSAAAFILSGGFRAAYTWDPVTFILVKTYTASYNSSTETWDNLTRTVSYTAYFSTQNTGDAYVRQEGTDETWKYDYSVTYDDSSTITTYYQWVMDGDIITYTYRRINKDAGGITTSGWDEERVYQVNDRFPEGVAWNEGAAVTFNTLMTSARARSWNTTNNTWGTWNSYDRALLVIPLSHGGTFIFYTTMSSTRNILMENFEGVNYED